MKRDIEKDLIEIKAALKENEKKDNTFTVSVLQRCSELIQELKEYRDLEEQGKLLKLPVAVGDTVYAIYSMSESRHIVYDFEIDALHLALNVMNGEFGKTVFLTKETAEAELKEMSE